MAFRVFVLSPARSSGKRASLIFDDDARFDLALRVRRSAGAPLGEVFSFLSGLYFRGKLAYANAFANPPATVGRAMVITSDRGLVDARQPVTLDDLRAFGLVPIDVNESRYTGPLAHAGGQLAGLLGAGGEVVLLGSIATNKYCQPLAGALGDRLRFPAEFAGRGDMSRGGLMLRCAELGRELTYVALDGAPRRGQRPPKLAARPRGE